MHTPILDGLHKDHLNFMRVLALFEDQQKRAASSGDADLELLLIAIDYFGEYSARYHHPLEDAIGERLKRRRPAVAGSVDGILKEHGEVLARLRHMRETVCAVQGGQQVSREAFVTALGEFLRVEREHMAREEKELFPAAAAVLEAPDWKLLTDRMPKIQDPLLLQRSDAYRRLWSALPQSAVNSPNDQRGNGSS